jgi:2-C-methyl-D-erythritol 2,4-cyclodiphosphate synthase
VRVGLGIDAHAFDAGAPLVLGGLEFPGQAGLAGHSDGDVITHALIDALLGAADLGDIGSMFPSEDDALSGISSLLLLRRAYVQVEEAGWQLANADCVLVGERPKIADRRDEMRSRLAETVGVAPGLITVRATTTDRLGFAGRGEGLAAQAVALLRQRD